MSKKSFESKYPNISRWVNQENGIIEIGWRDDGYSSAFVRAFDIGGIFGEGEDKEGDRVQDYTQTNYVLFRCQSIQSIHSRNQTIVCHSNTR